MLIHQLTRQEEVNLFRSFRDTYPEDYEVARYELYVRAYVPGCIDVATFANGVGIHSITFDKEENLAWFVLKHS